MAWSSVCLIIAVWFAGGFLNGLCGIGAALVALPFLVSLMSVQDLAVHGNLVGFMLVLLMNLRYRHYCEYRTALWLIIGSMPGIGTGIILLLYIPNAILLLCIGIFLALYAVWLAINPRIDRQRNLSWGSAFIAGAASGLTQGVSAFGGPPASIYAILKGWRPEVMMGTLGVYFFYLTVGTVAGQWISGLLSWNNAEAFFFGAIGGLGGFSLGTWLLPRVKVRIFRMILLSIVGYAGVLLLYKGIQGL